jgi:hypothetical protein
MAKHGTERRHVRHGNDRAIEASANIFREIQGRRFGESIGTPEASGVKNRRIRPGRINRNPEERDWDGSKHGPANRFFLPAGGDRALD